MIGLLKKVDRLLRGEFTREEELSAGKIAVPISTLLVAVLVLGAFYGAFMGLYSVLRPEAEGAIQLIATIIKVPLLFLLTLLVTLPSLYVFSALSGSRLGFQSTLRLLLAAITVNLALLASLGPVVGFFTLSTESYDFMIILNTMVFAISGLVGVMFLRRALDKMFGTTPPTEAPPADPPQDDEDDPDMRLIRPTPSPPNAPRSSSRIIFRAWIIVYGIVGAQMGWILRPFIGAPDHTFVIIRERESNFFEALLGTIGRLFGS